MSGNNMEVGIEINADVSGGSDVDKLATKIEQLAGTLDGDLKKSALAGADALRQLGQKDAAVQNFVDLKREATQAAAGLIEAQAAAQKMGRELSAVEAPTRSQTAQLQKLRDAVNAAKNEVTAKSVALGAARESLAQYGISTDNLSQKQGAVKTALAQVRTEVNAMVPAWQDSAQATANSAASQKRSHQDIKDGVGSISHQLALMQSLYAGFIGMQGLATMAKDVAQTADAYNNLQARIKLVTGEGPAFQTAFEGITAVAQRTSSSLESTGTLFTKLADAGKAMNVGQAEALKLTETVNQAVQLSGASAQASDAAITQLIQALQSGVLRGDEFNSIMEQAPRLSKAVAEGLHTTTGELRKMAEAGQLTSETVIKALQGQADTISSEFGKLPPTVGRALQNLSTNWTLYVGETDKGTSASSLAASAINALSSNLKTVAGYLIDAGQAAAAFAALKLAQHFTGIGVAASQAAVQVAASTAAVNAAGAAGTTAAVGIGRFASILGMLKTLTLLGIVTNFHDIGTAIGEGIAKLAGYKDKTEELSAADRTAIQIANDAAASRKRIADATQGAIDKQFDLSKAGTAAIAEFDKLTKEGSTAADAIAKIGKDFDLSSIPGIKNAASVLDKLAADGKISATEFAAAWAVALKGEDLAVFQVKAEAAFKGTAREAERLSQIAGAQLQEAVRRTGLDFDVIAGGMGKASRSAINDTEAIIIGLDKLKAQGVDTAQVLTASISKSIDTADSQKAIEAVRQQIESVRKVLGDKVTDGLLDQAKTKANELSDALDKAKPGINSVREAMKELGVTSDKTFQDTAEKSKAAYETMKESGTASARELADGFKKYAADAIAASGEVGSTQHAVTEAVLRTEGAVRGLSVTFDENGKMVVQTQAEAAAAIERTTGHLGGQRNAVDSVTSALERQNAAQERSNAAIEKAIELENKRRGVDKEGFATDKSGNRIQADTPTKASVYQQAKSAGLSDAQALAIADQFITNGRPSTPNGIKDAYSGGNWYSTLADAISQAILKNAAENAKKEAGSQTGGGTNHTYTINIPGYGSFNVASESDASTAKSIIAELARAKGNAGY